MIPLTLLDIEKDLTLCQAHLDSTNNKGTEIESFLTQFLLVRICGQYEKEIAKIVNDRATRSGDKELALFVGKTVEAYKHLKLDSIRGNILRRFGSKYSDSFDTIIKDTEPAIRYQNIIENRDSSAHGGSIQMTFEELCISHNKAKEVLQALSDVLNP